MQRWPPQGPPQPCRGLSGGVLSCAHYRGGLWELKWCPGMKKVRKEGKCKPALGVRFRDMTTSVVTGGAGFLGSHLCDYLLDQGHHVICVDNLETGSLENIAHARGERFTFLYHDVVEPIKIDGDID